MGEYIQTIGKYKTNSRKVYTEEEEIDVKYSVNSYKSIFLHLLLGGALLLIPAACRKSYQIESPGEHQLSPEIINFFRNYKSGAIIDIKVPRSDGVLLRMIVEMTGAKRALEIGTLRAYSATWIGMGLRKTGGKLTSLEIDPDNVKIARANLKKTGLDDIVTVIEGDALKTLPKLKGPFDFVFIDARKSDYYDYFTIVYPKVRRGGVIIAHNAIRFSEAMKKYLDTVSQHPELHTIIISTTASDGMALSFKKK